MSESEKTALYNVRIAGRDYRLRSGDSPEQVRRVSVFTDRRIKEVLSTSLVHREDAAVIAAMGLAEELLRAQDDNTRLRREMWQLKSEGRPAPSRPAPNPSRDQG